MGEPDLTGREFCCRKVAYMTPIPAKVVNVDRLGDQYLVTVRVWREKDKGAFDQLSFGENKPHLGWYHHGWLDIVYHQNPDLKLGQSFPLWELA
jgi:hypothetical protein